MTDIYFDSVNYTDFLNTISKVFKGRIIDGFLAIPSAYGTGYMKAVNLPNGVSVLISDCKFREDIMLHRNSVAEQAYILQFNEAIETPSSLNGKNEGFNMIKQMVLLSHTQVANKYFIPANSRLLSYKIIFHRNHLLDTLEEDVVDEVLTKYFSEFAQSGVIDPLDVDYRMNLSELIKENIDHPLAINFIQNRTMLLIEKFLIKFVSQRNQVQDHLKFSDNDIVQLMKIESMLVKDFSITPPNINHLSRISAMSPTKLKTDFKRLYGMPIYEYYQKNRMQRAKLLLLEGKFSIKEVGTQVGYSNLSHFAGSFKKEFGMLPSQLNSKDTLSV
jgi:AraC-like DNA-binding protein